MPPHPPIATPRRDLFRPEAELVYRFATPELALRAEAEQRQRCAQPSFGKNFDLAMLTPPCKGEVASTDGPMLRYLFLR